MRARGKQIPGLPKWAQTDRYDIAAKMSISDVAAINKLNAEQQLTQRRQMVQALLADRFKLKVHREIHDVPCCALIAAKNGPKNLNRVADDAERSWTWPRRFDLKAHATSIADLAQIILTGQMQCPVLDKTGVTGKYDFTLEWGDSPLLQSIQGPIPDQTELTLKEMRSAFSSGRFRRGPFPSVFNASSQDQFRLISSTLQPRPRSPWPCHGDSSPSIPEAFPSFRQEVVRAPRSDALANDAQALSTRLSENKPATSVITSLIDDEETQRSHGYQRNLLPLSLSLDAAQKPCYCAIKYSHFSAVLP
jgi:uncharacterized protein (TIGR03435 family)